MKVIITGATGLVGEGVMLVCLDNPAVTEVLSISRKPLANKHSKLKELLLKDFSGISNHRGQVEGYDGCFFCAGVSSLGENEESFTKKTFDFVVPFAGVLSGINPGMTFTYVSGIGTDSSEKGKIMWARVKGRTENALMRLPFKAVYNFRPGFMKPVKGQKTVRFIYRVFEVLFPVWLAVAPRWACTMGEVGLAMINCVSKGYRQSIIDVKDIRTLAAS
ncbi:MAG: nucleoside-diphosphate sugar epimerase [Chitinophagaceae bacterium]|nr:MAG: nucleoside-diphosphate sugar epimerase [Chitinophagaceae bacterium]